MATIEWVPAASALVLHCALRLLPEPASATALQPLIELAPSLKFTLPVGALPLTVAVKVTLLPTVDGVREVAIAVVVATFEPEFTTCDNATLVEPMLPASPLYVATMLWVPAAKLLVLQVAVRILPAPVSATAAQPLIDVAPSRKLTLPLGALPLTVAVKVTLLPTADGVREVAIPVVVVALLVLPVGSTNKVTLCAGTVVLKLDPVKAASARRVMAFAEVSCQARATPVAEKLARLRVTGVVPESTLLTTITVIAPSLERCAAKAERASGLGTLAVTLVSPKVE